jgi:hypothetical protein
LLRLLWRAKRCLQIVQPNHRSTSQRREWNRSNARNLVECRIAGRVNGIALADEYLLASFASVAQKRRFPDSISPQDNPEKVKLTDVRRAWTTPPPYVRCCHEDVILQSIQKFDPLKIRHELLRRLRDPRGQRTHKGWAGRSLESSIAKTLLVSLATWQGVIAIAAISSLGLQTVGFVVAAGHLVACGAALVVLWFDRGHLQLILSAWAFFVVDWAVSPTPGSTLLFASCWLCNLNGALPAFLLRGRASLWAPLGAAVATPVLMVITRPEWIAHPLVPGVLVTTIAITVATRIGLSYLLDYTDGVDAEAHALEEATASMASRKAATHQAAEDARVLHDTAINTLGAIANGGRAVDEPDVVRMRCMADIATLETLRSVTGGDMAARHGFRDAIRPTGIRVRYAGLPDDEVTRTEALLPARVVRAFSRVVAEAVQNAAKHSGAEEAVVSITRTADAVRVAVSDQGVGIQTDRGHGLGVERSILARAREAGIRAEIESTPGQGTTVTLDYDLGDTPHDVEAQARTPEVESGSVEDLVRQLRSRAVFALSAGLVGVGVALAALNHPGEATPEWLMVAVVAAASWLAWRERDRTRHSAWTTIALMAAGPVAFVLSAWAVGFGTTDPILWQAIAPTGPLLALMIASLPGTVKTLGFSAYLLTVGAAAASVAPTSLEAALVTVVAGLVGIGLVLSVMSFVRGLAAVATRANQERREAFTVGLELAAVEAAAESRRRWREAGLEKSVSLLRAIGEGRVAPSDPAIRDRCAEEEAFLRQLLLLNPELIQMGTWFARALNASRSKGVGLTVRSGAADATADDAPHFGSTLLTAVDALPPGAKLTTSFFATTGGLKMTLVAPTPHLVAALGSGAHRINVLKLQTLGKQDLVELVTAGSGS